MIFIGSYLLLQTINICLLRLLKIKLNFIRTSIAKVHSRHYLQAKSCLIWMESAPRKKAVVAIGLTGACRRDELCRLTTEDIKDFDSAMLVKIKHTKTKVARSFTITGTFYEICKKYLSLRPQNITEKSFFLNYCNGKCTKKVVGINKIGNMARKIAEFLNLPNPEKYTGHCFRRSSATILVNAGGDLLTLKRYGGWNSSAVAEGYIGGSINIPMFTRYLIKSLS